MRRPRHRSIAAMLAVVTCLSLLVATTAAAADDVTLTTPYPAVAVAPGTKVSFDLDVSTDVPDRVDLSLRGVPADWTASMFGGGFVVDGVRTAGRAPTTVRLDVTVPVEAAAATQRIEVTARSGTAVDILPLDIRVTPTAAGEVSLTTDFPQLQGPSTATFTFNLTLHNDTAEDLTFTGVTTGPAGWDVTTQVSTESQAASAIVKAGSTTPVTVTATAPQDATAGSYPIAVDVSSGTRTAHADLAVDVTGTYTLTLSTPDGRLNAQASAGSESDLSLVIVNGGTAPVEGIALTASTPTGWTVTFDPADPISVGPGQSQQVTAKLTPSGEAIAGDYLTTFRATADQASASSDIRVTVEASLVGGLIGLALIVLVLVGLGYTFLRYGRR